MDTAAEVKVVKVSWYGPNYGPDMFPDGYIDMHRHQPTTAKDGWGSFYVARFGSWWSVETTAPLFRKDEAIAKALMPEVDTWIQLLR